jgi:hypothetical protein
LLLGLLLLGWQGSYGSATPGVLIGDNATLRLDSKNVDQPNAMLRLDPATGGAQASPKMIVWAEYTAFAA